MSHGVPQGSVFSPFIFNCVMAELSHISAATLSYSLYADDLHTWATDSGIQATQHALQADVRIIKVFENQWYDSHMKKLSYLRLQGNLSKDLSSRQTPSLNNLCVNTSFWVLFYTGNCHGPRK